MIERICAPVARVPASGGAMNASSKSKRIKLVFGIIIPVLVLVTTIVMVSISFAWFSQETEASVQSINLSTQKAFVLEFGNSGTANENLAYMGQRALVDDTGFLMDLNDPATTNEDAAYYFVSEIYISTQGESKTLRLQLDSIKIANGGIWLDWYSDVLMDKDSAPQNDFSDVQFSDISKFHINANVPLAFTWFFKEHEGDAPTTNKETKEGKDEMKSILPQGEETWYTPYGTMKFGESGNLQTVNGAVLSSLPTSTKSIEDFTAGNAESGVKFDFYIVFAPEKVFWSQFFGSSNMISAGGSDAAGNRYYSTNELQEMLGTYYSEIQSTYRMYYSEERYQSSQFSFNATLNVID